MPITERKILNYTLTTIATVSAAISAYIANTQENHAGSVLSYAMCGIVGAGSIGTLLYLNKDYLLCQKQASSRTALTNQLEFDDTDMPNSNKFINPFYQSTPNSKLSNPSTPQANQITFDLEA